MSKASDGIQERKFHQLQLMQENAKESCMASFQLLHSFLQVLSYDESKSKRVSECAFMTLFGQDNETFTSTMFLNLDQLQRKLDKDEFQEDKSMSAFWVIDNQFQKFIDWQYFIDYDSQMTEKFFAEYTILKVTQFRETLLQHMGNVKKSVAKRAHHQRQYERRVNNKKMQMQESKIDLGSALDDTSSSSGNYITHVVDVNIRPVNDQVPFSEVQLTAQHNVLANEHQHTDQCEPIYDIYLLEKVDSNTSPGLTNMSPRGGEIDQDTEHDQIKSPLFKAKFLKMKDMVEKEVYNELSNRFLQIEKHCFSLEISIQQKEESFQTNKPCKNQDSPEFHEFLGINELKDQLQAKNSTINNLKKQIKHMHVKSNEAKTYKELFDLRIHTKDHNDSLIAQVNNKTVENADLKAQIQEKVFANAALKNNLRKLKGTCVDTKFSKPSIIGKPVLQPHRNQSDVRQPTAFQSERCKFSKPRFASHVDVINELSKPVTPHYVPKVKESVFVKPHHVIVSGSSRNSSNESYGSNGMAHIYYLEIAIGQRFSLNKSSAVREKPNTPRSCLRWIPTGRIFKTAGLSSRLALQRQMASADNTSGLALQRKEGCTLQCALSLEDEKSSYLRPFSSKSCILFHALVVINSAAVAAPRAVDQAGSPSSTTIDQDVPSTSSSLTTQEIQSQVTHQGAEEQIHGHQNSEFDNAPLIHNLSLDPSSEETTVQRVHSIKFTSSQPIV
uniref:Integrase, catalytic region, zinc finger, CCHC-type, peptidase aspartic, catalytic n=1 Tax=Tanacetum cinerariifolium TaxID=118510 RepID=A0A699H0D8_TANCI|nr:hypothetical protein [Tanacetum cinerariifolium]